MPVAATMFGLSLSEVLRDLGYAGLFALMLVETVFPPVPSEAILPLAGYLAESGQFNLALVIATSTAGSLAGAVVLYEAARHGGRPFSDRFLRFARIDPARLDSAQDWFDRRGAWVVLLGRCVPGLRSVVSLPAGVLHMPRWKYLLATLVGSLAWNSLLVTAGYLLGTQWERVSDLVSALSTPVLVAVLGAAAAALVWWVRRHRREHEPAGPDL
jgi:membrane protein DedA with SNARE-associated domain